MSDEFDELGSLISDELKAKVYEDAFSGPAKELSKLGVDAVKTARLLLAPLQLGAAFQDRFERIVERIRTRVPEANQIPVPPDVVGPVLEKLRYVPEDGELSKMFEEVLAKAIDKEGCKLVHPAFAHTISQLSRDEAWMLYLLRSRSFDVIDTMQLDAQNRFHTREIESSTLPTGDLVYPDKIELYYSHLASLSLVEWPITKQDPIRATNTEGHSVQTGIRRYSVMTLTDFGRAFVAACIPEEGFESPTPSPT